MDQRALKALLARRVARGVPVPAMLAATSGGAVPPGHPIADIERLIPPEVYRGHAGADPFASKVTLPTFTDVKGIAAVYAADHPEGRVGRFHLNIERPLILGMVSEDVVTLGELKRKLAAGGVAGAELENWVEQSALSWRADGDEVAEPLAFERPEEIYTDTYRVADSPDFLKLAKQAGYDGYVYRGAFVSEQLLDRLDPELVKGSSYEPETLSSMEFRPFSREQVIHLGDLAPVQRQETGPEMSMC